MKEWFSNQSNRILACVNRVHEYGFAHRLIMNIVKKKIKKKKDIVLIRNETKNIDILKFKLRSRGGRNF